VVCKSSEQICELFYQADGSRVGSAISGPLRSAVSVAPGTSATFLPTRGGRGVQFWAVWRPGVLVNEVWVVLAEPFLLSSFEIHSRKLRFRKFGVHQVNTR